MNTLHNYSVTYKRDHYNPYKSYPQNANRYVGTKLFATETEAREFAATVKEPKIYYLGKRI